MKNYIRRILVVITVTATCFVAAAQTTPTYTSSELLSQLKKLNVLGSVLYIAAHPDDENTRLLAYLANEKLYRTGYLSLTRGDGGQNLVGGEQGVELGLIRTQELLAARRIDGAEQFFTRAYDFGFSKSPEEALKFWGHDKILEDIVWVIRNFRPDVIITRFPTTGEGGHGHHTASALLAEEAFEAAADPSKFPSQLKNGITIWKARSLLWNTFNFGGNNTQRDDQFKVDVGGYNALLGKSYGEVAALSRSQHKSQGFGVPSQRGTNLEYFATLKGTRPENDLMQGVDYSWGRAGDEKLTDMVNALIGKYDLTHPERSVPDMVNLYDYISKKEIEPNWKKIKLEEIQRLVERCSGLYLEASSAEAYAVKGDTLRVNLVLNNRLGVSVSNVSCTLFDKAYEMKPGGKNENSNLPVTVMISMDQPVSQPYWLQLPMEKGSFNLADPAMAGKPESEPPQAIFHVTIEGHDFIFKKPLFYKHTDPVKGELYEPVFIADPVSLSAKIPLVIVRKGFNKTADVEVKALRKVSITDPVLLKNPQQLSVKKEEAVPAEKKADMVKNEKRIVSIPFPGQGNYMLESKADGSNYTRELRSIQYDYIPSIHYYKPATQQFLTVDVKINGQKIGYINGAGDKIPEALLQMGYQVEWLNEADINIYNLKKYDAIVTGVRAYNTSEWLGRAQPVLMQYVQDGGVVFVQYNTNNSISTSKGMGPYPFTISRNRVSNEEAKVTFLLPEDPVLHYPNEITEKDFEGWVQERSIYHADNIDSHYKRIIKMNDPTEAEQDGSLIIADYGKGRFIYSGLVFFRELPAGVTGAYRLLANILAAAPAGVTKKEGSTK